MLAPAPPPAAGPPAPGSSAKALPFHKVVVHPLVLLSVVDHYTRVAKDTRKRVVGVLLGEIRKGQVDVTNSFAGACKRHRNSSCSFEVPCAAAGCAALGRSVVA